MKLSELKRFDTNMSAIISVHVQANLFSFNKTNLPPLVCIGVIQGFCLSVKRAVRGVRNNLIDGETWKEKKFMYVITNVYGTHTYSHA